MQQTLILAGMLAGGLGLFMLAVRMITDGLKSAAGHALRDMLGKSTRSTAHGVLTGLISMHKSLGVIYGSNIGATITGWLVAIIGFKNNVEAFSLPMIGAGLFFIGIDVLK